MLGWECRVLGHGQSSGVGVITLHCGEKSIDVIPTRGMGIWQARNRDVRFGWDSPIVGPVHPTWVPVSEPSGLGWLDGFDEMMVRCGLANNGAPEFDNNGNLVWPLHGRVANLPASQLSIDIDEAAGKITIKGVVNENRFHIQKLQLQTEISLQIASDEISVTDKVVNLSNRPGSLQMLYHNNFGSPILEGGSEFHAPIKRLVPRNEHAASGLDHWNVFSGPVNDFEEQVYFMDLAADDSNETLAVLTNLAKTQGVSIRYDVSTLPCFSLWKNTVGEADGYVTGLEPATNFPNPRSFEAKHGRVVQLDPGAEYTMSFNIGMLVEQNAVDRAQRRVKDLSPNYPVIESHPADDWCSP